jgi:site-specific recombinase XerD
MELLREKMIKDMKLRGFSPRTQQSYVDAVAGLAKFYNQSPDGLNEEQVQEYLLYLMEERRLSWSTCNVAISAFRFLYGATLGVESICLAIPPRKKVSRLPEILSAEDLVRLFNSAQNPKHRVLLMTTYGGGLRVSEVVRVKVTDIDGKRMMIRVDQGKGNKDRYTTLSERLLEELRLYWKMFRPPIWLFPSPRDPHKHINITTAQRIYYKAKEKAKITRGKGIHTLRHCFATHMLEAGYDPRTIQILMGHTTVSTTMIYTQVTQKKIASVKSPLDLLQLEDIKSFE